MSNGTLVELIATGTQAHFLTDDPDHTMWRHKWKKASNYASETIVQGFSGNAGFGSRQAQCTLNRVGDLIYRQFLRFHIPGIKYDTTLSDGIPEADAYFPHCDPCDPTGDGGESIDADSVDSKLVDPVALIDDSIADLVGLEDVTKDCIGASGPWAHYVQAIGFHLVRECKLMIGGQQVDCIDSDVLYMWEELSGKSGKRLEEMIGKRETRAQLILDSYRDRYLYVPLPWWFCRNTGNSLPLIGLQFHTVQLQLDIADLRSCIVTSVGKKPGQDEADESKFVPRVLNKNTRAPIQNQDLTTRVESEYIFLDQTERDYFVKSAFEQLITVHQINEETFAASKQVTRHIQFNHPVLELMWRIRRDQNSTCNNHFNYSGLHGHDPLENVTIKFNGMDRVVKREASYFRTVQPYQHHSSIPRSYTYCFSFAQHPEHSEPTGSANFSRIDTIEMQLEFQKELYSNSSSLGKQVNWKIVARNWNLFRYKGGLGGPVYAN